MRAVVAAPLILAAGCAGLLPGLPPRLPECPGPIPSTAALPPGDWLARERVRVVGHAEGGVDLGLDVVAEKRGDRLVVVGFLALGAKAFSLVQEGSRVEVESHLGRALAVPPRNVLRDLYAAGLGDASAPERVHIARPECRYTATLARVEQRALPPDGLNGAPSP